MIRKLLCLAWLLLLSACSAQPALSPTTAAQPPELAATSAPTATSPAAGSAPATAAAPADSSPLVFVGTYTQGPGKESRADGIFVYRMDPSTGALNQVSKVGGLPNPSYLTVDPSGRYLIAVSETGEYQNKPGGAVSSYAIEPSSGALTLINSQPVQGESPCYVSVDPSGKWVLMANYMGGSVTVLPLGEDGRLGEATAVVKHSGKGPNKDRQEAPHAHSIILAPGSNLTLAADLGIDRVMLYDLDTTAGTLAAHSPAALEMQPGSGPRHMAFHPNQRYLYVVSELSSSLTAFQYDAAGGSFQEIQTVSLLPADFKGTNTSADIHVAPSGKFLYASNRGHDSLAVFSIDEATGKLTLVDHTPTQGKTPRNFAIDPTGKFLLVANQDGGSLVSFRIDLVTGKLTPTGQAAQLAMPVCIKFLK